MAEKASARHAFEQGVWYNEPLAWFFDGRICCPTRIETSSADESHRMSNDCR
jgi:hypothetical protein